MTVPLKHRAKVIAGQSLDSAEVFESGRLPFIQGCAEFGELYPQPIKYCDSAPKRAQSGDVLVSVRAPVGATNVARFDLGIGRGVAALRPFTTTHPRYLYWYVVSAARDLSAAATGSTFESVTATDIGALRVPDFEVSTQQRIANFLDEKTARIDALIAEKERLLELLIELTYATISSVGLGNLAHGLKRPTGNRFVPSVPVHWHFGGLTKYLESVVDYRGRTPEKVSEGVSLVTARNIRDGRLDYDASTEFVRHDEYEEIMRRGRPEIGDVLFTTEAPLGEVANVDRVDIALAQRVVKFRGKAGVLDNFFLKYWLMGDATQMTLRTLATGSTAEGIKASKLGQIPLALPPLEEQRQIVRFLDKRIVALYELKRHVECHVDRLREYRDSMIAAVVTGQLDASTCR